MATYTENYSLKLPGGQDPPDIDDINENMEIIDAQLKKNSQLVVASNDIEDTEG